MGSFTAMNWGRFHRTAPNFGADEKSNYLSPTVNFILANPKYYNDKFAF
jgi:hypothetical protein